MFVLVLTDTSTTWSSNEPDHNGGRDGGRRSTMGRIWSCHHFWWHSLMRCVPLIILWALSTPQAILILESDHKLFMCSSRLWEPSILQMQVRKFIVQNCDLYRIHNHLLYNFGGFWFPWNLSTYTNTHTNTKAILMKRRATVTSQYWYVPNNVVNCFCICIVLIALSKLSLYSRL